MFLSEAVKLMKNLECKSCEKQPVELGYLVWGKEGSGETLLLITWKKVVAGGWFLLPVS